MQSVVEAAAQVRLRPAGVAQPARSGASNVPGAVVPRTPERAEHKLVSAQHIVKERLPSGFPRLA
jgi:hypothetical protein